MLAHMRVHMCSVEQYCCVTMVSGALNCAHTHTAWRQGTRSRSAGRNRYPTLVHRHDVKHTQLRIARVQSRAPRTVSYTYGLCECIHTQCISKSGRKWGPQMDCYTLWRVYTNEICDQCARVLHSYIIGRAGASPPTRTTGARAIYIYIYIYTCI